jgi:glycosyltransferase involved in cell wall biosynthesis
MLDRPLKVTYLGFVEGHGGDALQMLALARGMSGIGADVEIVVPCTDENATFVERCRVAGLPARQTDLISMTSVDSRQRLRSLVRMLRELDCDVLHIHAGDSCLPRKFMIALGLSGRRSAFATLQSPYQNFEPGSGRARFWAASARVTLDAVVSPSDHATHFQRRCGIPARQAVTIRNSIDRQAFASGDPNIPRQVLGLDPATPVVLFSSRLDDQKRPLDAVRAFALAAPEPSRAILVLVGSGAAKDAIVDEARRLGVAERVLLPGYRLDIPNWLAAATIWLFPTERENFSVALLEAMAAGCPIVATLCPGNDEVLLDGSNALTFEIGDVDVAAAHVRRLLDDRQLRERLSAGARATALAHSVERMVEQYRVLYGPKAAALPDSEGIDQRG